MATSLSRTTWPLWILTLSVLVCAIGCAGTGRPADRAYPASRGVLVLSEAEWALDGQGRLRLVAGFWQAEKDMSIEDIRYNFRRGVLLTPGFVADLLKPKP